jgi:Domain of unknown function (DUF4129)
VGSYTHKVDLKRRRLARVIPIAAAIIGTAVGLGLVVISSARRAPQSQPGEGFPELLKNLGAAAIVVYVAIAIYLVVVARFRGQLQRPVKSASQSLKGLIVFVAVILFISFLVTKFHRFTGRALPSFLRRSPSSTPAYELPEVSSGKPITWGYQLGFVLVLLIVLVAVVITVRKRRSRVLPSNQSDRRSLVAVSLDDLLTELDNEPDPRRAVLLADHGMEMALAQHGLPREMTETAQEHVQRVAAELSLSSAAAQKLTTLYGQAHFGANEITPEDRRAAIAALRSVRDALREEPLVKVELP